MQELELAIGLDQQQPVGLCHTARDLGQELRPGDPDGDRQADPLDAPRARSRRAMSIGFPAIRRRPLTSRKASSIDNPSTIGVVSSNTSNTALLASV